MHRSFSTEPGSRRDIQPIQHQHAAHREGFHTARSIKATGRIDADAWTALKADSAPAFAVYSVTAADVSGPYAPTPVDMMERAKLRSLPYQSIEEALGESSDVHGPSLMSDV